MGRRLLMPSFGWWSQSSGRNGQPNSFSTLCSALSRGVRSRCGSTPIESASSSDRRQATLGEAVSDDMVLIDHFMSSLRDPILVKMLKREVQTDNSLRFVSIKE